MRWRTAIPRPIVLGKGETTTVYIDAQLRWRGEKPVLQLGGTDPTGGFWHFDKLAAGKYLLHVEYENTEKTQQLSNVVDGGCVRRLRFAPPHRQTEPRR